MNTEEFIADYVKIQSSITVLKIKSVNWKKVDPIKSSRFLVKARMIEHRLDRAQDAFDIGAVNKAEHHLARAEQLAENLKP